ncbi:nucleotidyltransferase domain-containing protein, partial [candidate division KSB1 bacterium]|nr:nucleotidyltransferase domain-containing protein [candidate division KSB1 bacterium]
EYGFCHVDLVFLDGRNILLEFEAVRHNRLVFARPEFDQGSVFSITLRKYFDFLPYLKVQRQAYKEQVLNG